MSPDGTVIDDPVAVTEGGQKGSQKGRFFVERTIAAVARVLEARG